MFNSSLRYFLILNFFYIAPISSDIPNKDMPFGNKAFEIYQTAVELRTAKGHQQQPKLATN